MWDDIICGRATMVTLKTCHLSHFEVWKKHFESDIFEWILIRASLLNAHLKDESNGPN